MYMIHRCSHSCTLLMFWCHVAWLLQAIKRSQIKRLVLAFLESLQLRFAIIVPVYLWSVTMIHVNFVCKIYVLETFKCRPYYNYSLCKSVQINNFHINLHRMKFLTVKIRELWYIKHCVEYHNNNIAKRKANIHISCMMSKVERGLSLFISSRV